jgi:Cu/Zn superoxide dismutase
MRITIKSTVAVAVAVAAATLVPGTASAQENMTGMTGMSSRAMAALGATPFADATYGAGVVRGKAKLEQKAGRLIVKAEVQGLKPGTSHVSHLHFGNCASLIPGEVVYHLSAVKVGQDGQGRSVTVIPDATRANLAAVKDCDLWVAFHEGAANTTPPSPAAAVGPVLIKQA